MTGSLFDTKTIQQRFEDFHQRRPEVYAELVRLARLVRSKGFDHYSIDALMQRVRWHFQFERDTIEEFRVNDHFSSRYARKLMDEQPDLVGMFETRRIKAS